MRLKCQSVISREHFSSEPELSRRKWFDYRPITCEQATQMCADAYVEAARRETEKRLGNLNELGSRPLSRDQFYMLPKGEPTAIWRCRQMIDALGVPYPFFFGEAFKWLFESAGVRRVLRPNQIISEKWATKLAEVVLEEWGEAINHTGALDRYLTHPLFLAENYRGTPDQDEAIDLQAKWALKVSANAVDRVKLLIDSRQRITVERARVVFGSELVDRALTELEGEPQSSSKPTYEKDPRPSCFGLPGAYGEDSTICGACSASRECQTLASQFIASLKRTTGSDDPVARKKRNDAAIRQRRRRARLAAERQLLDPGAA